MNCADSKKSSSTIAMKLEILVEMLDEEEVIKIKVVGSGCKEFDLIRSFDRYDAGSNQCGTWLMERFVVSF